MEQPGEYDIVHPIWVRGREYGIAEERERIIALLQSLPVDIRIHQATLIALIIGSAQ